MVRQAHQPCFTQCLSKQKSGGRHPPPFLGRKESLLLAKNGDFAGGVTFRAHRFAYYLGHGVETFVGGTAAQESRDKDLVPPGKFGRRDFVQFAGDHVQEGGGGVPAETSGAAFRHARGGAGGGAHGGRRAGVSGASGPEIGQRGAVPPYSGAFFGMVQGSAGP